MRLLNVWLASLAVAGLVTAEDLPEKELKRKAMNDANDRANLRQKTRFVVEKSDAFIQVPALYTNEAGFDRARTAPTVKLQILPDQQPEYFSGGDQYMACWANWAYVARSDDNRFFMAASDHLAKGSDVHIYTYAPGADAVTKAVDVDDLLGWTADQYTDGKLHGHMGIISNRMLWGATHFGIMPDAAWYAAGYRGAWLFSFDLETGTGRNWGTPLPSNSLSCFTVDTRRGILAGTGEMGGFLCWDCNLQTNRFAGPLPNGWKWSPRSMLLDPATGMFWGQETSVSPTCFIRFDPATLTFKRFATPVPAGGAKSVLLRGHTDAPARDGWFYWATQSGQVFKFKPQGDGEPLVEPATTTWDKGRDTLQLALSPKGRYLYWMGKGDPSPVVQYDVTTGRKKALCWLQDHFFEKYGYWMDEVYGLNLSTDGSFLVICMNGTFTDKRSYAFGHPSCVVVEIPESERVE